MTALLPRIALPCNDMRALFAADVVAVRLRTERELFAVVRDAAVPVRDTTLRDVVARDAPVLVAAVVPARDTTLRVVAARDAVVFVAVRATFVFATVFRGVARDARDVAVPARDAWGVFSVLLSTGAIGSAKTARIDKNVEQTKNAPANKNTVPTAFLQQAVIFWRFIKTLLYFWQGPETRHFLTKRNRVLRIYLFLL